MAPLPRVSSGSFLHPSQEDSVTTRSRLCHDQHVPTHGLTHTTPDHCHRNHCSPHHVPHLWLPPGKGTMTQFPHFSKEATPLPTLGRQFQCKEGGRGQAGGVGYTPVSICLSFTLGGREGGLLSKEKSLSGGAGREKGLTWAWERCRASQLMCVRLPQPPQSLPWVPGTPQPPWGTGPTSRGAGTGPAHAGSALPAHCLLRVVALTSTPQPPRRPHVHPSATPHFPITPMIPPGTPHPSPSVQPFTPHQPTYPHPYVSPLPPSHHTQSIWGL